MLAQGVAHRCPPRVLAHDQAATGADLSGVEGLVEAGRLEHPVHVDTGLVHERRPTDDGLPARHRTACRARNQGRERPEGRAVQADPEAEQVAQCHRHLLHGRVAGPFTQSRDRGADEPEARPDRRERVGGGETEVVMGVDLPVGGHRAHQLGRAGPGAERLEDPDGVGPAQAVDTIAGQFARELDDEAVVRPRSILKPDPDQQAQVEGGGGALADPGTRPRPVAPELVRKVQVGDGDTDVNATDASGDRRVDVGPHRPAPSDDLRPQPGGRDTTQYFALGRAHGRHARLDLLHSRLVERDGDGELLLGREGNSRGLLTITQGGVTEPDHAVVPHSCPPSVEKEGGEMRGPTVSCPRPVAASAGLAVEAPRLGMSSTVVSRSLSAVSSQ